MTISWTPASIVTSPVRSSRILALDANRNVVMIAEAMPQPMRLPPSVRLRGAIGRSAQPNRRAPSS